MASTYSRTVQSSADRSLRGPPALGLRRRFGQPRFAAAWLQRRLRSPSEVPRIEGMAHKGPLLRESLVTATLFLPRHHRGSGVMTHTLSDLGDYRLELPRPPLRPDGGATGEESTPNPSGCGRRERSSMKPPPPLRGAHRIGWAGATARRWHIRSVNLLTHLSYRRSLALWQGNGSAASDGPG